MNYNIGLSIYNDTLECHLQTSEYLRAIMANFTVKGFDADITLGLHVRVKLYFPENNTK